MIIFRKISDQVMSQNGKVASGRVVVWVWPSVRIHEVGVVHSEFLCLGIHAFSKGLLAAGDSLGHDHTGVISRLDDYSAQQVFELDAVAEFDEHLGSLRAPR